MSRQLALRVARPLYSASQSGAAGSVASAATAASTPASAAASAAPDVKKPNSDDPSTWPTQPSGANATAADGSRVRVAPTTAWKRKTSGFDSNRNAHLRSPPAFPALQPFFKVAHVAGVVLLVGITLVTGFETLRGLATVRGRRLEWEKNNPEQHAALVAEIQQKKNELRATQHVKYAVSAIDPEGDERRRQEAEAIRTQVIKAPAPAK
jgi:hypothetical protein